jgi:hypothetical protein
MITLPSLFAKLVNGDGRLLTPWNSYLQQFTQVPAAAIDITVGASPLSYQAKEPGTIVIVGGTITALTLTRGTVVLTLPTATRLIPVCISDILTITYSVIPTSITLLPAYGIAVR